MIRFKKKKMELFLHSFQSFVRKMPIASEGIKSILGIISCSSRKDSCPISSSE